MLVVACAIVVVDPIFEEAAVAACVPLAVALTPLFSEAVVLFKDLEIFVIVTCAAVVVATACVDA